MKQITIYIEIFLNNTVTWGIICTSLLEELTSSYYKDTWIPELIVAQFIVAAR